jgi:hypothetical protein
MVSLLNRFPCLQPLLRVWGSLPADEQRESLTVAIQFLLRSGETHSSAYRYVAEFASIADLNARGEREQADAASREAAERRRQIRIVPSPPPGT